MAHAWLAIHGWSTIPEFYYPMCFFNLILNFCLYCRENIPFLLLCYFWSCFQKQPLEMFCKKVFLRILQNSQENACIIKKRLWYRCFPVNFVKFLTTLFLQDTSGQLLLRFITFLLFICCNFIKNYFCPKEQ